jgi:metal-dependent amidase/aminoacylase/carboxypeptidase family protein
VERAEPRRRLRLVLQTRRDSTRTADGRLRAQAGTVMAAADRFWARVQGRGGHGAMPHLAVDPVVAAAAVVAALQPLVSRETSPTSAAVVTVAEFNTGEPTVCNLCSWLLTSGLCGAVALWK